MADTKLNLGAGTTSVDPVRTAPERGRVAKSRGVMPKEGNKRLVADVPTGLHNSFRRQADAERTTITGLLVRVMQEYLERKAKDGTLFTYQTELVLGLGHDLEDIPGSPQGIVRKLQEATTRTGV